MIWAQLEAANWYFGINAGVSFNTGEPVALTDGQLVQNEGCATISDSDGNLLFYTNGVVIYNANHTLMPNGTGLLGNDSSTQSAVIIPKPGSETLYYVFTIGQVFGDGLSYSVVDMTLDGGLGDVVATQKNILLDDDVAEKINAVYAANGEDIWVLTHRNNSNQYLAYKVTSSGIVTTPVVSATGITMTNALFGALKISPNGKKIACATTYGLFILELLDFDNETGQVSNPITLLNGCAYGVEFSPDSNILYCTVVFGTSQGLYQYDITSQDETTIQASQTFISSSDPDHVYGSLQLAINGKMYVTVMNESSLSVVNAPGNLGTACNFEAGAVDLAGNLGQLGLPPFIQSYFQVNIDYEDSCANLPIPFSIETQLLLTTVHWNFGDPQSGQDNESTGFTPEHIFSEEGVYTVTMEAITTGGDSIFVSQEITILHGAEAHIVQNLIHCDESSDTSFFDLTEQNNAILGDQSLQEFNIAYYLSEENAKSSVNNIVNPASFENTQNPQEVFARVTNIQTGCYAVSSFNLEVYELPIVAETDALTACETADITQFDLTQMEPLWITTQDSSLFTFEYYPTEVDAENQQNEITNPDTFASVGETLYARIINTNHPECFVIVDFQTEIIPGYDVPEIADYELCDDDADGFTVFDLTTKIPEITGGSSSIAVNFYANDTDLLAGNAIANPENYTNSTSNQQTIYVSATPSGAQGDCTGFGSFHIVVNPLPVISSEAVTLQACDIDADGFTTFYLYEVNELLLGMQNNMSVYYYESLADAEAQTNILSTTYVNTQTPVQTIYARVQNTETGCFSFIKAVTLQIADELDINTPSPLEYCDPDNDGFGTFDLGSVMSEVIPDDGGNYNVSIHETYDDAQNNVNVFTGMYENIVPEHQTLFVRVSSDASPCYHVVPLELIVYKTPVVSTDLTPLEICDDNIADGLAEFNLSLANEEVYGNQLTTEFTISYYASQNAAILGANPLPLLYTNMVPFEQTVYVRLENNTTGCFTVRSFKLLVNAKPVIAANYDHVLALCDDFGEEGDEQQVFDLTSEYMEVTGNIDGSVLSFYHNLADAQAAENAIPDLTVYQNQSNPETLYIRVADVNTDCASFTTVTLRVLNNPSPLTDPEDLETCDDDADGDNHNGQAAFNLTTYEIPLLNGEGGVTATYYESYENAFTGTHAITTPESYYNIGAYLQTIYVAVTNDMTGCMTIVDFDLIVHPLPEVTEDDLYYLCETDNDNRETLPLTQLDSFVMDGGSTSHLVITYHNTLADTGQIAGPNITVVGTRAIVARVEDTETGCVETVAFTITIKQAPLAFTPEPYVLCETENENGFYNDGVEVFDLISLEETILGGQSDTDYTVSFYTTQQNAINNINAISDDEAAAYESGTTVVYAVVTNTLTGCTNGEPIEIILEVEPVGEVILVQDTDIVCVDATNNPVIGTDLGAGFVYSWNTGATTPTIEVTEGGEYYVTVTNMASVNQCVYQSNHLTFEEASLPGVTPTVTQSQLFSGDNTIEVTAEGSGISEYGFTLDDGLLQEEGIFKQVEPGVHTITITELNGCGSLTLEVYVVDYMKYFTPNGDGVNDKWRIIGMESQPNAQVFVFDRYGKLLKQMSSTGEGWDGTYNGVELPSTDYWFKVVYTEPSTGTVKEFGSHFTLKR